MNLITQDLSEFLSCKYGLAIRIPVSRCITKLLTKTTLKTTDPDLYSETELLAKYVVYESKSSKKDSRLASVMKKYIAQALLNINYDLKIDLGFDNDIANFYESMDGSVLRTSLYNALRKLDIGKEKVTNKSYNNRSPINFVTVQNRINDIVINGTPNGIGVLDSSGKNLLKQTTTPIPNGAVGTFIEANTDGWFNGSQTIANGYSFNTKTAKRIVLVFANSDQTALSVSDVGNLMLVEGTTVPDTYDADTNLYKKNIIWGGLYPHTYKPYPGTYEEDDAQELYAGDNGYGAEVLYRIARSFWETRCKTYVIDVEPNTDYSVRLFGSSVTLMSYIYLLDEPGTVQQTFMPASMQGGGACAIPSCGEYVTDTEQWCRLDAIMAARYPDTGDVAVDVRPNKYEFCESFAELEAGTYKLIVEVLGNHTWNGPYVGFTSYGGNIYDSFTPSDTYPPVGTYERFAVIAEDNTLIIPETNILDSTTVRYSTSAPYPNFHHKEYTFTLASKTKVGVIHRGYSNVWNYHGGDGDIQAYFRFMICDADVEAEEFESTNLYANISGESAWEPYKKDVVLHLNIKNLLTGDINTEVVTLSSYLYSEDTAYVNHIECSPGLNKIWVTETDNETGEPATIRFSSNR